MVDVVAGAAVHRVPAAPAIQRVVAVATGQQVGAIAAAQFVGAVQSVQAIVALPALDEIVQPVAAAGAVPCRVEKQLFQVVAPGVAGQGGANRVDSLCRQFNNRIGSGIDQVNVVALSAGERVVARAAIEPVGAGATGDAVVAAHAAQGRAEVVADDDVVQRIAGAGSVAALAAHQCQVLDVVAERPVDRRINRVGAESGLLDDGVENVIDDIGVVTRAAGQHIGSGAAVQPVVACVAREKVGAGVAGGIDVTRALQRGLFNAAAQRDGCRGEHPVVTAVGG